MLVVLRQLFCLVLNGTEAGLVLWKECIQERPTEEGKGEGEGRQVRVSTVNNWSLTPLGVLWGGSNMLQSCSTQGAENLVI